MLVCKFTVAAIFRIAIHIVTFKIFIEVQCQNLRVDSLNVSNIDKRGFHRRFLCCQNGIGVCVVTAISGYEFIVRCVVNRLVDEAKVYSVQAVAALSAKARRKSLPVHLYVHVGALVCTGIFLLRYRSGWLHKINLDVVKVIVAARC